MNEEMLFANNLKKRRKELGLTQKELADLLGYSEKSVSKWESGATIASSVLLPQLARCLNTSIDFFFKVDDEPQYYLGIDGGGTKTEFLLCDKNFKKVNHLILPGCNPVDIGIDKAFDVLKKGIAEVLEGVSYSAVAAYVGIAGGITGNNKELVNDFIKSYGFSSCGNGSDASNAVAAGLGVEDGVAVILGTGSIAYTKNGSKIVRTGGFGYLFDDRGSGYSIGKDAVNYALWEEQDNRPESLLTRLIKEKLSTGYLMDKMGYIYSGGKRTIADFCPQVFEAMLKGDENAKNIIESNVKDAIKLIEAAVEKLVKKQQINIVLIGSVANRSEVFSALKAALPKEYKLSRLKTSPVMGAVLLARNGEYDND